MPDTTQTDPLEVFGLTVDDIVDAYVSATRSSIGNDGPGVTKPRLRAFAEDHAGVVSEALLQRGFDPLTIQDERASLWRAARRVIKMGACADGLRMAQRMDEANSYRAEMRDALRLIMEHETDIAVSLPSFVR